MNRDIREPRDLIAFLPGVELGELIRTHQQVEGRGLAQSCEEVTDRFDSVRASGAANLDIRRHEMAVTLGRETHHREPMLGGREIARRLMRRRRGWDEVDQVEAERLAIFLGRAKMAEMDRIKTAAEQSYPHAVRLWPRGSGANLSIAGDHVLVGGQFVQPHRPSCM